MGGGGTPPSGETENQVLFEPDLPLEDVPDTKEVPYTRRISAEDFPAADLAA